MPAADDAGLAPKLQRLVIDGDHAVRLLVRRICVVVRPRQSVILSAARISESESASIAGVGSGNPACDEGAREPLAHQLLPAGQDPALRSVVGQACGRASW